MPDPEYQTKAGCDTVTAAGTFRVTVLTWLVGVLILTAAGNIVTNLVGIQVAGTNTAKIDTMGEVIQSVQTDIREVRATQMVLLRNHHKVDGERK